MKVLLANPRGFCAGVDRAITIVERALEIFGRPIYVRHEVVHNRYVVDDLKNRGAIFVNEISEVPDDSTVIFSAHGVSQSVRKEASNRDLTIFDATCPLVTKVHLEVARYNKNDYEVILIGHAGHPDVEGTMGQYKKKTEQNGIYLVETIDDINQLSIHNLDKLGFVTQTTLSSDDTKNIIQQLKQKFPNIEGPKKNDICYATQNRQDAVKTLVKACDLVLVVGSVNSSNSNRLKEIAIKHDIPAYLIDQCDDIKQSWLKNKKTIGITAGASAPEILVNNVIQLFKELGAEIIENSPMNQENVIFPIPKNLVKIKPKFETLS